MIQTVAKGGYSSPDLSNWVNDWLKEYEHRNFSILSIQYQYSDGYAGVMIVYDTENNPNKINTLGEK